MARLVRGFDQFGILNPASLPPHYQHEKRRFKLRCDCPDRRRWAALIKHIYQADPLLCPQCGGTMKIIAFIEAHQADLIRKTLEHCGLWHDPPPRAPRRPSPPSRAVRSSPASDTGITHEVDPDFLEHLRREAMDQSELPWEP